eukprot:scaffold108260_cov15-Prasinocladus_malaysianus.AAC.1
MYARLVRTAAVVVCVQCVRVTMKSVECRNGFLFVGCFKEPTRIDCGDVVKSDVRGFIFSGHETQCQVAQLLLLRFTPYTSGRALTVEQPHTFTFDPPQNSMTQPTASDSRNLREGK